MNSGNPQSSIVNRQSPDGPQIAIYCQPCKERRATESPAKHFPGGTPMCDVCFGGRPTKRKEEIMPRKVINMETLRQGHAAGMLVPEMVGKFGFSAIAIYGALKRAGLKPHKAPKGRSVGSRNKPRSAITRSQVASAGGNFQRRRKARNSPVAMVGRVTLSVDETFLDGVWANLDLPRKAALVNKLSEV